MVARLLQAALNQLRNRKISVKYNYARPREVIMDMAFDVVGNFIVHRCCIAKGMFVLLAILTRRHHLSMELAGTQSVRKTKNEIFM